NIFYKKKKPQEFFQGCEYKVFRSKLLDPLSLAVSHIRVTLVFPEKYKERLLLTSTNKFILTNWEKFSTIINNFMLEQDQKSQQELNESFTSEPVENIIPLQYQGMPSEIVEELWGNPIYIDEEKNQSEIKRRNDAIEAIRNAEFGRELQKQQLINERYASLSDSQKIEFSGYQKDASDLLSKHIKGEEYLENLSPEEAFVLQKLKDSYENFKKGHPNESFNFQFERDIDKSVYNNLVQRLSFKVLENKQAISDQQKANDIREKLGIPEQRMDQKEQIQSQTENKSNIEIQEILNIEERKKLFGWEASYELAKIAKSQGIDLSSMSREEYAQFAIDNSLAIDDSQLRMASWQRMFTSIEELLSERRKRKSEIEDSDVDKSFTYFRKDIQNKAAEDDRFIGEGVKVRSGTKDSNSWLFFGINDGIDDKTTETYKSYVSVKDIKTLTPERFKLFMAELQKNKYNGDIKIFNDLVDQGTMLNDQIVMHGRTQYDAELGLDLARQFFGNDLDQRALGKDEIIDGKNLSYSQILADKIKKEINKKSNEIS
ncbi:MAG: hypothetical protein PHH83_01055, partial [Patescibacteria group bacterium]|nr:hypothetical protein [Patescibacteria group bacterium]